jgi:hypothetical protein
MFGSDTPDPVLERRCTEALEAGSGNIWRAADILSVWQGWVSDVAA